MMAKGRGGMTSDMLTSRPPITCSPAVSRKTYRLVSMSAVARSVPLPSPADASIMKTNPVTGREAGSTTRRLNFGVAETTR